MKQGTFQGLIASQALVGTLFNTYTTAKSILNAQGQAVLPGGFLSIGDYLRIKLWGALSNIVTTPGTLTLQVMLGPTANIIAFTSGAIQLNATAHVLLPFEWEVMLRVDSVGNGTLAKLVGQGKIWGLQPTVTAAQVDGINTHAHLMTPATAPAVGTGFDSTVANLLDLFAGFSISNAGNGIQVFGYTVESLN